MNAVSSQTLTRPHTTATSEKSPFTFHNNDNYTQLNSTGNHGYQTRFKHNHTCAVLSTVSNSLLTKRLNDTI